MSGIFISHSSKDKDFVYKLACHLSIEGYPVWLDTWSMKPGDSLLDKIFEALDESTIVIIVLSINSIESNWVKKELNAALLKEEELGRKFIIPIAIDETLAPLKIRDRLQARFFTGFYAGIEALSYALNDSNIKDISIPFNERMVPIEFARGIHLKKSNLLKHINFLKTNNKNEKISVNNIVIPDETKYRKLKEHLFDLLESLENMDAYSQDLEDDLQGFRLKIERFDGYIRKGLALLINQSLTGEHPPEFIVDSCYWFSKRIRAEIICKMKCLVGKDKLRKYAPDIPVSPFKLINQADPDFKDFYEIKDLVKVVVFNRENNAYVVVFCDGRTGLPKFLMERIGIQDKLKSWLYDIDFIYKYFIPQMIYDYLIGEENESPSPILWDFEELHVGLN